MPDSFRLTYIPALDGLRGIAILLVMGSHAALKPIRGGFIGVDIFFVLSGFLITSLLVKEWEASRTIHLKHFYARRALRLAPALLLFLCVINTFMIVSQSTEAVSVQHDTLMALLYISNWAQVMGQIQSTHLLHLWSLSIEEQFYLAFPVLLAALLKCAPRWTLARLLATLSVLSWVWRMFLLTHNADLARLYNGTDTRLDGLLAGAAVALLLSTSAYGKLQDWMTGHRQAAAVLSMCVCVCVAMLSFVAYIWYPLTYVIVIPLTNLASCSIIITCVTISTSRLKAFLEWPPLVHLGRISYSVYLWHIFVNERLEAAGVTPVPLLVVGTVTSIAIAQLSYQYLEAPMLKLKARFAPSNTKSVMKS